MNVNLYDLVVEIIGVVPSGYQFIYALGTIFLLIVTLFVIVSPFIFMYQMLGGKK